MERELSISPHLSAILCELCDLCVEIFLGVSRTVYAMRSKIPAAPIPPPMHIVTMP
jgi:hypothetical protein